MSFSTLIFTAAFLPIFMAVYTLMPGVQRKNRVLLLFSVLFYLFAGLPCLILLLCETGFICFLANAIEKSRKAETAAAETGDGVCEGAFPMERRRLGSAKLPMISGVAALVLILSFFKYYYPAGQLLSIAVLPGISIPRLALPLGISFYSFKLISYLADVYMGKVASAGYFELLLYTIMLQEVSQGPISRFPQMQQEIRERRQSWEDSAEGLMRFSVGLAKKTVLADHAGMLAEQLMPLDFAAKGMAISSSAAWLSGLMYMLQLYLDFSAYSDMAIGLLRFCGFHIGENFNYPYAARSVRDFWRRWHISLSAFFRDYVYIPLGGSRAGFKRLLLNSLAVWLLTGIWHGSSLNFLLWGLYYFIFLTVENLLRKYGETLKGFMEKHIRLWERAAASYEIKRGFSVLRILGHVYTLLVVYFGWVLFRFSDFATLKSVLKLLLHLDNAAALDSFTILSLKNNAFFLFAAVIAVTPLMSIIGDRMRASMKRARDIRRKALRRREEESLYESPLPADLSSDYEPEPVLLSEDEHKRAYYRLRKRIQRRSRAARRAELVYYTERTVISLLLIMLSVLRMVGSSYVPFLYNQF